MKKGDMKRKRTIVKKIR